MMHSTGDNAITGDSYTIDIGRSELANARSPPRPAINQECAPEYDEEAVWSSTNDTPATGPCCGRRNWAIALVGLGLIIAIIAMALAGGNVNSISNEAANNTTTTPLASTTEAPPTTVSVETTSASAVADNSTASTTLPTNSSTSDVTTSDGTPPTTASDAVNSTTEPPSTVSSTVPPTDVPSKYNCEQGHLLEHNVKLESGQYMCSSNKQYRFGMHENGSLVFGYAKDDIDETAIIYNGEEGNYFKILSDGNLMVYDRDHSNVWKREPFQNFTISSDPYLYLQNDGHLVLNWVNDGKAERKNILRVYDIDSCEPTHFLCL